MIKKSIVLMLICFISATVYATPQLFEVGPQEFDQLPDGKEADGIQGDYIIKNDKIIGVISADLPRRKANMGTNWTAITPGTLYDLTFVGADNDQLTIFAPSNQEGPITYGRIVSDGSDGRAVYEVVVNAANNDGVYKRHEYILEDGWQGLLIKTQLKNESDKKININPSDRWKPMSDVKVVKSITVGDAIDPADKNGYAYGWVEVEDGIIPPVSIELNPGEEVCYARFFAVGRSPLEAFGEVAEQKDMNTGKASGYFEDTNGNPVTSARIKVYFDDQWIHAYPDENGYAEAKLPKGNYDMAIEDMGRETQEFNFDVTSNYGSGETITLPDPSGIAFNIKDLTGNSIPCKVQFIGINGTETPYLGPNNRAHGTLDQYHSETGKFTVQIPSGDYKIVVTRGIEFTHISREVKIQPEKILDFEGELERVVDTTGWISADFHNHSSPSGDNTTGTYDRVINLAAEQVEFAPTTEHNRLYDWMPYIKDLGLEEEVNTVVGIELTGSGAHFNAFPFHAHPHQQDGGAPEWNPDPRISAITLRNHQGYMPERWVQINHPDMVDDFIDRDGDGNPDGGYHGLAMLIDGAETWAPRTTHKNILTDAPLVIAENSSGTEYVYYQRQFIWLQKINQGDLYWNLAVSDAHTVHGNGVGGWRTYIPSSTDLPAKIDWKEIVQNAKKGQIMVTNGPFIEVKTDDGTISGGFTRADRSIDLDVKVQCTDWINIDRIQVMVNGRKPESLNFTRKSHPEWFKDGVVKFDQTINVPLSEDSHLIVVAYGEDYNLETGYGTSWQSAMNPCAYNNPIFVDVDGNGFQPNYDTLGYPLPTRMNVEQAREFLKR